MGVEEDYLVPLLKYPVASIILMDNDSLKGNEIDKNWQINIKLKKR